MNGFDGRVNGEGEVEMPAWRKEPTASLLCGRGGEHSERGGECLLHAKRALPSPNPLGDLEITLPGTRAPDDGTRRAFPRTPYGRSASRRSAPPSCAGPAASTARAVSGYRTPRQRRARD